MELRVFVCKHVFDHSRPTLLVANTDGDLCFMCGAIHADNGEEGYAVGLNHVLEHDPTLIDAIEGLPANWESERSHVGVPWVRTAIPPDELK